MVGARAWLVAVAVAAGAAVTSLGQEASGEGVLRGAVTCGVARTCQGALVYVERVAGQTFPPGPEAVMDQRRLTFLPHVLTVVTGTSVVFRNSDTVWHNVFSASPVKRFNLGTYAAGVDKRLVMDKVGVVELLCNVHPEMSAYIVVADTPFAAHVDADGRYEIRGLPEATLSVVAWREMAVTERVTVELRPGETRVVDFSLRR